MPVTSDQIERLVAALRSTKSELSWLLTEVGADSIGAMSPQRYIRGMSWLQRRRAAPSTDSPSESAWAR